MGTTTTSDTNGDSPAFTTTHWSLVLASQTSDPARSFAALEALCRRYWFPLYAFARREGRDPEDAKDLAQGFFAHLLANRAFNQVDRARGRFRTFLLSSFRNFSRDEWDRQQALKRGGGVAALSWDGLEAEERFAAEPAVSSPPEQSFDRDWAVETLRQALRALKGEQAGRGSTTTFARLERYLTGEPPAGFYTEAARELSRSEESLRVEMHRLRKRLGELLREMVAATVERPEDVQAEILYLRDLLAG